MVARCLQSDAKQLSLWHGCEVLAEWCQTVILVAEFSVRTSQPLKILIIFNGCEVLAEWCRTVILVAKFSIRTSQPLKILIIFNGCEVLAEWCWTVTRVTEFSICTEEPVWILFLEYVLFSIKKSLVWLLSYMLTLKRSAETDVKMTSRHQNRHTDVMHKSHLAPPCKTTFPSPGRVHRNPGQVCKRHAFLYRCKQRNLYDRTPLAEQIISPETEFTPLISLLTYLEKRVM